MIAYHGDEALKVQTIATMREHRDAERLGQGLGFYWNKGRGCAVGCLTGDPHGGHYLYPRRWGVPVVLAKLEDRIFEGLPQDVALGWPERFFEAMPTGAELAGVWPRFALAMLLDAEHGVLRLCSEGSQARAAVANVGALFERQVAGVIITAVEWQEARAAAYAAAAYAAAYAAAAAADAAAAYAAYAAADADAADAAYAAYAAARQAHYVWMADLLVRLLSEAPLAKPS